MYKRKKKKTHIGTFLGSSVLITSLIQGALSDINAALLEDCFPRGDPNWLTRFRVLANSEVLLLLMMPESEFLRCEPLGELSGVDIISLKAARGKYVK